MFCFPSFATTTAAAANGAEDIQWIEKLSAPRIWRRRRRGQATRQTKRNRRRAGSTRLVTSRTITPHVLVAHDKTSSGNHRSSNATMMTTTPEVRQIHAQTQQRAELRRGGNDNVLGLQSKLFVSGPKSWRVILTRDATLEPPQIIVGLLPLLSSPLPFGSGSSLSLLLLAYRRLRMMNELGSSFLVHFVPLLLLPNFTHWRNVSACAAQLASRDT